MEEPAAAVRALPAKARIHFCPSLKGARKQGAICVCADFSQRFLGDVNKAKAKANAKAQSQIKGKAKAKATALL